MGNFANKLLFYSNETRKESNKIQIIEQQTELENKDMCTPTFSERRILVDPRSASAGIPRTPIEVKFYKRNSNNNLIQRGKILCYFHMILYFEKNI